MFAEINFTKIQSYCQKEAINLNKFIEDEKNRATIPSPGFLRSSSQFHLSYRV